MKKIILVAGATGNLGQRIVQSLVKQGVEVRVLVRPGTDKEKIARMEAWGVKIVVVAQWTTEEIKSACADVSCVVSAMAGLREVIVDAQKILLDAAIAAGVPRFIPSDYSLDFTTFSDGENRNLDLRREFHTYLDQTPIAATSIFNGAFMDMLLDQMPMILVKPKRILYWGSADQLWGFTTIDNTAEYTARVACDESSPRYLHIAGDLISPREVQTVTSEVLGMPFRLFRPGGQGLLGMIIKLTRLLSPGKTELYPAWQGMQYMHNMIDDRAKMDHLDNDRYADIQWTTVKDLLRAHKQELLSKLS